MKQTSEAETAETQWQMQTCRTMTYSQQRAAVTLKGTKGKWETTAQHRESRAPATTGQRQSSECRREKGIREQQ